MADPQNPSGKPGRQQDSGERPRGQQGQQPAWRGKQPPANRPTNSSMRAGGPGGPRGRGPRTQWLILGVILAVLLVVDFSITKATLSPNSVVIPYKPTFLTQLKDGNIATISSKSFAYQGTFKTAIRFQGSEPAKYFSTQIPSVFASDPTLKKLLIDNVPTINARNPDTGPSFLASIIVGIAPALLIVFLLVFFMRRAAAGGGAGGLMSFGRSRARRVEAVDQPVTFDDVAGIDEAKDELNEIVDFLRNPDKYLALGAKIPRGVLLSGPPGTGKTLLARAVAGEAGVPFFQMSASEFVEMIVGVGASRVRDLFAQAKEAAPAIIFVDELDAVGRSRASGGANIGGGHDEREQTLNQILTEMDGFSAHTGVIVLGATNRPEILDPALLRPGRFDRRVVVQPPDRNGREAILRVHTRSVPLAADVDLGGIASTTPGMVGADLANLVNEAALLAARRGHDQVEEADFTDALEKIVLGAERKVLMSKEDKRRTAYHEGGHAVVGMLTPGADPVRKISIIPRGLALGVTFSAPDADRYNYSRDELMAKIKVALGGRSAEEVVFGDLTTGAESDFQQLTQIARHMVGRWGMSDTIGTITVIPQDGQGPFLPGAAGVSEETARMIDDEVRKLVAAARKEVLTLLHDNRDKLDALAHALLEHETLDQPDAYAAAGIDVPASAVEGP